MPTDGQRGFWHEQQGVAKLQKQMSVFNSLAMSIALDIIRSLLDHGYTKELKCNAGRKKTSLFIR
jgi:hypothetical protein